MALAQVNVVMRTNGDRSQTCNGLASGACCKGTPGTGSYFKYIDFSPFPGPHIATVWQQSGTNVGCSGRAKATSKESPWNYVDSNSRITGASWASLIDPSLTASLGGTSKKQKMRRGARIEERDNEADTQEVYPDVITVRGVEYSDEKRGDLVYRDAKGNVLELDELQE
ncbi:MAG: hypothetical protein M1835_001540 [Candelina submexicana]|nr:MAG: hypothetical protein M1835_001540 [Candelina submexicana]